jgi:hypothetical protein
MSYGREPFYIFDCACAGADEHPKERHISFDSTVVRWDELAQFVATLHWRGELGTLIARGYEVRPALSSEERNQRRSITGRPPGDGGGGR